MLLKQNAYFQGIRHATARSRMGTKTNKNPVSPKLFQCLENRENRLPLYDFAQSPLICCECSCSNN